MPRPRIPALLPRFSHPQRLHPLPACGVHRLPSRPRERPRADRSVGVSRKQEARETRGGFGGVKYERRSFDVDFHGAPCQRAVVAVQDADLSTVNECVSVCANVRVPVCVCVCLAGTGRWWQERRCNNGDQRRYEKRSHKVVSVTIDHHPTLFFSHTKPT